MCSHCGFTLRGESSLIYLFSFYVCVLCRCVLYMRLPIGRLRVPSCFLPLGKVRRTAVRGLRRAEENKRQQEPQRFLTHPGRDHGPCPPLSIEERNLILDLWRNENFKGAAAGSHLLWKALKEEGVNVTQRQVEQLLQSVPTYVDKIRRLHPSQTRPYRAYSANKRWEIDIAVMDHTSNDPYRYFLLAIDIFTRKIFTSAMPDRQGQSILKAFQACLHDNSGEKPEGVQGDQEFRNPLLKWLRDNDIYFRYVYHRQKAALAEYYIFQLKKRLTIFMEMRNTRDWWSHLAQFTKNINDTPKSVLGGIKPSDIRGSIDDPLVWAANPDRPGPLPFEERQANRKEYQADKEALQLGDIVLFQQM